MQSTWIRYFLYAIKNAKNKKIKYHNIKAQNQLPFKKKYFD